MEKFIKSVVSLLVVIGLLTASYLLVVFARTPLPDISSFNNFKSVQSVKVLDRDEQLLFDFSEDVQRESVAFEDIPDSVIKSVLAVEDDNFFEHNGIYFPALIRSTIVNVRSGSFRQGGSTITQQIVKNILLTSDKEIERKLKELILAIKLENVLEKEEILEIYLNNVAYGGTIYGISEATESFFEKHIEDITLAESAYLASLLKAPSYYSPYGNNRDELRNRKNLILERMLTLGLISRNEYIEAINEEVVFAKQERFSIQAPHFVFFVKEELENRFSVDVTTLQGQPIKTTLDLELQNSVQEKAFDFSKNTRERLNASNISVVVLSVKTGEVLAMVGSRDYFDEEIDGEVNATISKRQPGSAFKPFSYAQAFEVGFRPETVVFDVPTQFSLNCDEDILETNKDCYSPQNFDEAFVGPISLSDALAQSRNVPAVKTLYLAGLKNVFDFAKSAGLKSLNPVSLDLSLGLGGADTSLLELVNGYSTIANEGVFVPYRWQKEDEENILLDFGSGDRVLSKESARDVTAILSDSAARSVVFPAVSRVLGKYAGSAIKTGTTNNSRDIWIVGYNPDIVVGVWAGNNEGEPLSENAFGVSLAPLWVDVFDLANEKYGTGERFVKNNIAEFGGVAPVVLGDITGGVGAGEDLEVHSILNYVSKRNPSGGDKQKDDQFEHWEFGVENWLEDEVNKLKVDLFLLENEFVVEEQVGLSVLFPYSGETDSKNTIDVVLDGNFELFVRYEFYVNDTLISNSHTPTARFVPFDVGVDEGLLSLRVIGYTADGERFVDDVFINIKNGEDSLKRRGSRSNVRKRSSDTYQAPKSIIPLPVVFPVPAFTFE